MESDRQGRAPRGPYFFFFLVAFFFANASPPLDERIKFAFLLGMLVEVAKICQG
jgi:hypothetical protein